MGKTNKQQNKHPEEIRKTYEMTNRQLNRDKNGP